jgi:hypothetical protein
VISGFVALRSITKLVCRSTSTQDTLYSRTVDCAFAFCASQPLCGMERVLVETQPNEKRLIG